SPCDTPTGLDAHLAEHVELKGSAVRCRRGLPGRHSCATHSSFSAWRLGLRLLVLRVRAPFRSTRRSVKEVAATASPLQPARWRSYRRWGWWGHTKCYREFVIGPYSCHW